MKKRYFFGIVANAKTLIICLLIVVSFITRWGEPTSWWISPQVWIIITIFIYINFLTIRYTADEKSLRIKSLLMMLIKNEPIKWREVTHIEQFPGANATWLHKGIVRIVWRMTFGHTVIVRANNDKSREIFVMSGLRNYKELMQIIIDKCKENPNITIDPRVLHKLSSSSKM